MLKIPHKERLQGAIESFSLSERIVFYCLLCLCALSALFLGYKVNEYFTVKVPAPGGTIREGIVGYPRYINPLLSVTDAGRDLSALVFSGLFRSLPDGSLAPDLAKEYSVSEDGLTYKIILRDDIYFHDGNPVTAYDVEFTIKKALDPILKSPEGASFEGVSTEVISSNEIHFILKKPYALFLENLTLGILPRHIWKDVDSDAFAFSQYNFEPVGSGAYKITDIKRNSAGLPLYYHLVPFDKNSLGKAFISNLYFYFFTTEEKVVEALNNGTIDAASSLSPETLENVKNKENIIRTPLPRIFGLFFNQNEKKIFLDQSVRFALDIAVDREALIKDVLKGYGTPALSPLPHSISGKTLEAPKNEDEVEKAKNILEKGGWKLNSAGIMEKTDKKEKQTLSFTISTGNAKELKDTAFALKEMWKKIGADVDVKIFELSDLQQNIIRPRKYESLLFGEVIGRELDLYAFWHSSERNDPGLNIALYTNSKADKYLETARQSSNRAKRIEALENFEKEVLKDTPAVFLFSPDFIYLIPKNISNIRIENIVTASDRFININKWFIETEPVWNFLAK